jgi:alpha-1,2-mannosyltransferase
MPDVDTLRATRTFGAWANLDLRKLNTRERVAVITVGILALAAAGALAFEVYRRFGAPRNEYDLRIYYSALNFWHGGNDLYAFSQKDPVNGLLGFTYPPVAAILMSPMTALSIRPVVVITSLAILGATVGLVLLSLRERVLLRRPQMVLATGFAVAAAFCLQPISQTAAYGQVNTFLALLVMFDIFVLSRRGSRWAGIGIGLAMAIKLTPAVFLLYLVLSKQWRMLRVSVATAAAATVVAGVVAPVATWRYFTSALWDSSRVGVLDNTANQSLNGTLARFSGAFPPDKILWALGVVIVVVIASVRIHRAVAAGDTLLAVTVTGLLGVLVSPVSWLHHAVWIVPAMVVLFGRLVTTLPRHRFRPADGGTKLHPEDSRATRRWIGTAVFTAVGLVIFMVNTRNMFDLPDTGYADLTLWSRLAGSVQAIWMLAAVMLLPTRTPADARRLAQRISGSPVRARVGS